MTDASGATTYTYDDRDRLLTKATPQGTLTYTYDGVDNLTSTRSSNADGVSVDYTYDDLNRLDKVIDNRLTSGTTQYTYDDVGNLASDVRPNGDRTGRRLSSTEQGGRTITYTYDEIYRLTREAVTGNPNPTRNGAVDYVYDSVSNRLSRISNLAGVLSATSAYDANDRLTTDSYD